MDNYPPLSPAIVCNRLLCRFSYKVDNTLGWYGTYEAPDDAFDDDGIHVKFKAPQNTRGSRPVLHPRDVFCVLPCRTRVILSRRVDISNLVWDQIMLLAHCGSLIGNQLSKIQI